MVILPLPVDVTTLSYVQIINSSVKKDCVDASDVSTATIPSTSACDKLNPVIAVPVTSLDAAEEEAPRSSAGAIASPLDFNKCTLNEELPIIETSKTDVLF